VLASPSYIQYDSEKKYIQSIVKKSIRHRFIYILYGLRAGTTTRESYTSRQVLLQKKAGVLANEEELPQI
jgi:hypothetical protein